MSEEQELLDLYKNKDIDKLFDKVGQYYHKWLNNSKKLNFYKQEIERLNNIINELEKEIDRLLERQYESERFAKEQGFDTYLPAKVNLLCVKNKLQELKGDDKK